MIAACSKKNDPIANAREAAKDKDLQNKTFVSDCSAKPLDALITGLQTGLQAKAASSKISYKFTGANVTRKTEVYSTTDCTGDAAYTFVEAGTFSINKDQKHKSNDGGYLIDFDYDNLKVTVISEDGIKVANSSNLCGAKDWTASKERDVTAQAKDANCYASPLPRHVSNRYRVDANVLQLGTGSKGDTKDQKRPDHLEATKYTAK
jgi:hypothetical protein